MRKMKISDLILHAVMIALALVWIYPYVWLFMSSFKPAREIFTTFIPSRFTLEHYEFIFFMSGRLGRPFLRALLNSVFVASTVTFSVVMTSAFVGFVLAKIRFLLSRTILNFILYQMLFPGFMFLIPLFMLIRTLGLMNSYSALILPGLMSSWGAFMFAQSFKTIPDDYIDAAK
ncbi:MAG: carbohydrate ABC transporter permease, partial [Pseudothermotoga sp.]|nr:carbohydrate ABC transporter permease [Pseudothermotoga sp.]